MDSDTASMATAPPAAAAAADAAAIADSTHASDDRDADSMAVDGDDAAPRPALVTLAQPANAVQTGPFVVGAYLALGDLGIARPVVPVPRALRPLVPTPQQTAVPVTPAQRRAFELAVVEDVREMVVAPSLFPPVAAAAAAAAAEDAGATDPLGFATDPDGHPTDLGSAARYDASHLENYLLLLRDVTQRRHFYPMLAGLLQAVAPATRAAGEAADPRSGAGGPLHPLLVNLRVAQLLFTNEVTEQIWQLWKRDVAERPQHIPTQAPPLNSKRMGKLLLAVRLAVQLAHDALPLTSEAAADVWTTLLTLYIMCYYHAGGGGLTRHQVRAVFVDHPDLARDPGTPMAERLHGAGIRVAAGFRPASEGRGTADDAHGHTDNAAAAVDDAAVAAWLASRYAVGKMLHTLYEALTRHARRSLEDAQPRLPARRSDADAVTRPVTFHAGRPWYAWVTPRPYEPCSPPRPAPAPAASPRSPGGPGAAHSPSRSKQPPERHLQSQDPVGAFYCAPPTDVRVDAVALMRAERTQFAVPMAVPVVRADLGVFRPRDAAQDGETHRTNARARAAMAAEGVPPVPAGWTPAALVKRTATKRRFTAEEDRCLEEGMRLYGTSWIQILLHFPDALRSRDQVQLKDRARTIRARRTRLGEPLGVFAHASDRRAPAAS